MKTINTQSIKNLQSKNPGQGNNAINGTFALIANPGSQNEFQIGYTTEGTFNVEKTYRSAEQNTTTSNVKGLTFLDEAVVFFETETLELNPSYLENIKKYESEEFTDTDGVKYNKLTEPSYVKYNSYIKEVAIVFQFTDGRTGAFILKNVLDMASESINLSRTDDATIPMRFEAHVAEGDNLTILPYELLIQGESESTHLDRAASELEDSALVIDTNADEASIRLAIEVSALEAISNNVDYANIEISADNTDVTELVSIASGSKVKDLVLDLTNGGATGTSTVAVTYVAPATKKVIAPKVNKEVKFEDKKEVK